MKKLAWVETVDGEVELSPTEAFTFGRSELCTFQVDGTDRNISRVAGSIAWNGSAWILQNRGSRSIHLTDELFGLRRELPPGGTHLIDEGRLPISLLGAGRSHYALTIVTDPDARLVDTRVKVEGEDSTLGPPKLSAGQRLDLAALFWEYHEVPSRREPRPLSYELATRRRGGTAKALEHRVFELRQRLRREGYPAMEDNHQLARFMMTTRTLRAVDFERLEELGEKNVPTQP